VERISYLENEMTKFGIFRYAAILSMTIASQAQAHGIRRHEAAAPSWSAACVTYHGATVCGEPVSIYGARDGYAAKKNAMPPEVNGPNWIGD
jgi:hypothetical protein